ncbi:MAG TPA: hypothetical protein VN397_01795 [Candidatus Methylomirabilis sp.]|nr:hypothetical protein [Candidatus Methylomirabilis sp.]
MNKRTFSHKIGLIFLAIAAFAIAGCGATASFNVRPVERGAVVTFKSTARASASPTPVVQLDPNQPTSFIGATAAPSAPRAEHDLIATSFAQRNQGSCGWVLRATGDSFNSVTEAVAYAKGRRLADMRVDEVCDVRPARLAIPERTVVAKPVVSMR